MVKKEFFIQYKGTPHFAAPEIVRAQPYQGPQAEIWSLGVLLYTLVVGENPFVTDEEILAYKGIVPKSYTMTPGNVNLVDLYELLSGMLCVDVRMRYTLSTIKSHRWCAAELSMLERKYAHLME